MPMQHIVLFSFPRELSASEAAQMREMVASWPSQIGLMTKCRLGTDLTGATAVTFNGAPAAFTIDAPTEITATVPAGATTGTVQVATPTGTLLSPGPFTVLP